MDMMNKPQNQHEETVGTAKQPSAEETSQKQETMGKAKQPDERPEKQETMGVAKEMIGEVNGNEERAAEGRAEQDEARRGESLKESVDRAIVDTSGSERTRR
jgi:uncharacterized protein YjbJ (UPF0337 family)